MKNYFAATLLLAVLLIPQGASAALTDNLVGYWKFDENSGNAADATGNGITLTNSNVASTTGKINNGADFGTISNQRRYTSTSGSMYQSGAQSFSFWLKSADPALDVNPGVLNRGRNSNGGYQIWRNNAGQLAVRYADSSNNNNHLAVFANGVADGSNYHHVVIIFRVPDGAVDLYLDGAFSETLTGFATTIRNSGLSFEVMGDQSGDLNWGDGQMDELGYWSRALTSTEVSQLYNGGAGLAYPLVPPVTPGATQVIMFEG